jgi:hypothetical protein
MHSTDPRPEARRHLAAGRLTLPPCCWSLDLLSDEAVEALNAVARGEVAEPPWWGVELVERPEPEAAGTARLDLNATEQERRVRWH